MFRCKMELQRGSVKVDIVSGMQSAIDYIENHLTDDIDYNHLAQKACMSNFYFQRMFSALCGYTVGDYIRFRRLTLAGSELLNTDAKVIDAALKYGYNSPESFSRAFAKFHGVPPSAAKSNGSNLKTFSRLYVNIILRGGTMENFKVVKKEAFTVLEKVEQHTVDNSANKNTIPEFWERCWCDGTIKTILHNLCETKDLFGICYSKSSALDSRTFDYSVAGICKSDIDVPEGFRINTIPARTWLVFDCVGPMPDAMQSVWHKLCSEVMPSLSYEPTYEFDIEAYTAGNMTADDYKSEIWIPVKEKQK